MPGSVPIKPTSSTPKTFFLMTLSCISHTYDNGHCYSRARNRPQCQLCRALTHFLCILDCGLEHKPKQQHLQLVLVRAAVTHPGPSSSITACRSTDWVTFQSLPRHSQAFIMPQDIAGVENSPLAKAIKKNRKHHKERSLPTLQ